MIHEEGCISEEMGIETELKGRERQMQEAWLERGEARQGGGWGGLVLRASVSSWRWPWRTGSVSRSSL